MSDLSEVHVIFSMHVNPTHNLIHHIQQTEVSGCTPFPTIRINKILAWEPFYADIEPA